MDCQVFVRSLYRVFQQKRTINLHVRISRWNNSESFLPTGNSYTTEHSVKTLRTRSRDIKVQRTFLLVRRVITPLHCFFFHCKSKQTILKGVGVIYELRLWSPFFRKKLNVKELSFLNKLTTFTYLSQLEKKTVFWDDQVQDKVIIS